MLAFLLISCALSVFASAAAITKRNAGSLALTNYAVLYYEKDMCAFWKKHCDDMETPLGKRKSSTCSPIRQDHGYSTVVQVSCTVLTRDGPTPITDRVARFQNWQNYTYGILVPHIAKAAEEYAVQHPGFVFDQRELAEYASYWQEIQRFEKNNTKSILNERYLKEYSKYFKVTDHYQRYDVPVDEEDKVEMNLLLTDQLDKVAHAVHDIDNIENSPKTIIPEIARHRDHQRPRVEKLPLEEYVKLSELER